MDVYIGVGSNLGDRLKNIKAALAHLGAAAGIEVEKVSSIIETFPQGGPPQGNYLNAVLRLKTDLSARALLVVLQDIERRLGRERKGKNGPRTIDLDILLYGDQSIDEPDLKVPHPRMRQREFVMKPLAEIVNGEW